LLPLWHATCEGQRRQAGADWKEVIAMRTMFRKFLADESGATAIEYGLIAAGISLAIIAVVNGLGTRINTKFTSINNSLK
jgi:pilus assembly protein Flp/PilA